MGAIPGPGGTTFRVWAPHARARLRHRHVRRLGRRPRPALERDGTARAGRGPPTWRASSPGDEYRYTIRIARRRPLADRPVRPPGDELGRQRGRLRPWRRSTGATTRSGCRPGTTSSSTSCTSGRSRRPPIAGAPSTRPASAAPVPCEARHLGRPGDAALRVRGGHLLGLQPGAPVRGRVGLRRAGGLQALHPRSPRARHRRDRRRRLQPLRPVGPGPLALRRLGEGRWRRHLLLQRQPRQHAVGRHPSRLRPRRGPHVPPRQRDRHGSRSSAATACASTRRSTSGPSTATPATRRRRCRTAGRSSPGSTTRSAPASPGRSPSPRTCRTIPRSSTRRRTAAPGSRPSGTPASSIAVRPVLVVPDDADRDMDARGRPAIVGEGRGAPLSRVIYTESHDEVANGQTRVPEAIAPGEADSWWAKKRAMLGSALVLTSPGDPDALPGPGACWRTAGSTTTIALDWAKAAANAGILRLHRDLIALRRGPRWHDARPARLERRGSCAPIARPGLLAMHRWMDGGPARRHRRRGELRRPGRRRPSRSASRPRAAGRSASTRIRRPTPRTSAATSPTTSMADGPPLDGCGQSGRLSVGPYSVVILSREE